MIKVNLLNPGKKDLAQGGTADAPAMDAEKPADQYNNPAVIAGVGLGLAIIGLIWWMQVSELDDIKRLHSERQARKTQLEGVLKTIAELESTKMMLEEKVKVIERLKGQQKNCVKMMDFVSASLPRWVWLTELEFSGSKVTIKGKALSSNLVADFITKLKGTNHFENINFDGTSTSRTGQMEIQDFSLTCDYKVEKKDKTV